jgi:ADP-heptose:LPS heptosyltransferase
VLLDRVGLAEVRSFQEVPFDPELHASANNLRAAGFVDHRQYSLDMDLVLKNEETEDVKRLLDGLEGPVVGLHPGYGPRTRKANQASQLRGWGTENFSELGRLLIEDGASVVVTGSGEDQSDSREICKGWPVSRYRNLAGRTSVSELGSLLSLLSLHVSVDSGSAHIAAAVGTPLIVLWGPGKLAQTRPISSRAPAEVIRRDVPCSPCWDTPVMKECRNNICMKNILPSEVMTTARSLLTQLEGKESGKQ